MKNNVTPLRRSVRPISPEVLHRIFDERPNLHDTFAEHIQAEQPRRGLLDRIADWLGTDRGFSFFLGFYSGAMLCCGSLILWVVVLK